jgi:hypothetical protein
VALGSMMVFAIMFVLFAAPGFLDFGQAKTLSVTSIGALIFLFLFWFLFVVFVNVLTYFMPFVMYCQRCRAIDAFREVLRLITGNIGIFILFCLFGFALFLAMIMTGAIVSCLTCCLAALPYVGTVILLPVYVCLRAFGLLFLRQFGPDYDVWASFMPSEFWPSLSGAPPAPPFVPPELPSSGG